MGTLYVVGTPIGNLEDITLRALRVLREVGLIAAEDTRTTGMLLARLGVSVRLTSLFEGNEHARVWNNLGYAYRLAGERDTARRAYVKALELDPNHRKAHYNLQSLDRGDN